MIENTMKLWNSWKTPPEDALKKIQAGRLKGKSDINPQWRFQALTEQLGPCGEGWRYEIVQLWTESIPATSEVTAFARVDLYVRERARGALMVDTEAESEGIVELPPREWSAPIPGVGGSMLVENQKSGPYVNDDAFKMAVTDALSVAMKALGVAADVYRGLMESKYAAPAARSEPDSPNEKTLKAMKKELDGIFGEGGLYDKDDQGGLTGIAKLKLAVLEKTFGISAWKKITAMPEENFMAAAKANFRAAIDEVKDSQRTPETVQEETPF